MNLLEHGALPTSRHELNQLNDTLLYGSSNLSFDENEIIFKAVHQFIIETKRFDMN